MANKNMGDMMKQVQKMQRDMQVMQERLAAETVEAQSGGGMVTCTANGQRRIVSLKIEPECVDLEDLAFLEDLVVAAVNAAIDKVDQKTNDEMSKLTGGSSFKESQAVIGRFSSEGGLLFACPSGWRRVLAVSDCLPVLSIPSNMP